MQITLDFSEDATQRLEEIKRKANTDSNAEVIRNALRIYEWHIAQTERGYEIGLVRGDVLEKVVTVFWD